MTDHCDVQTFFFGLNEAFAVAWLWCHALWVMSLWFDFLSSDVASCEVICGTTPVLICTTKNYNVLLQTPTFYSVLQRTTPTLYYKVLIQYYSVLRSTTLYCKVLLQYYSELHSTTPVLQNTTPVLLCTTKYRSSTTLYYKELRQYYNVLLQY